MPEFDAIGRDVFAAADSIFTPAVAGAFKTLWTEAGFDQAENPNHLWTVTADVQSDRFTLTAVVKDGNVYVSPPAPHIPASVEELARTDSEAEPVVDDAPAEPAAVVEPETAEPPAWPPSAASESGAAS